MWNSFNLCDRVVSIGSRGSLTQSKQKSISPMTILNRWIFAQIQQRKFIIIVLGFVKKIICYVVRKKETSCSVLVVTMTLVWHFWKLFNPFYDDNLWFEYVMVAIVNGLKQDIRLNVTTFQECLMCQFQINQILLI